MCIENILCIGRDKPAETVTSGQLPEVFDEFAPLGDSNDVFTGPDPMWHDLTITPHDGGAVNTRTAPAPVATTAPPLEVTVPEETLEKKKRRLVAYEESFINDDAKLSMFEQWYGEKKYDVDNDLYKAWLIFKQSAAGTPKEALNFVLESKVPREVPKSRKKRKTRWYQEA